MVEERREVEEVRSRTGKEEAVHYGDGGATGKGEALLPAVGHIYPGTLQK